MIPGHGTNYRYVRLGCRCDACRKAHNEAAQRYGTNVRAGNRGAAKRRWDDENRLVCACGNPMARKASLCVDCRNRAKREALNEKRREIQRLWGDGQTVRQIADALGTTTGAIGVEVSRMRADGWDIPFRAAWRAAA